MMQNKPMSPLVSIGIPTFNRPVGLRRTLECITAQTYQNLEIIISDNASPNSEVERIACEFVNRDARVKYFRQAENMGPVFNFKFVLEQAQGEYFMWAADDDEWVTTFCEALMEIHLKGNYSLVSPYTKCLQPDGKVANLRRIDSRINADNKESFFINFLRLHHWNYTKADLVYGIYRINAARKNFHLAVEVDSAVGGDVLFLLGVIADGNCFYLDKELRIRRSNYFIVASPYLIATKIIKYVVGCLTFKRTQTHKMVEKFSVNVDRIINREFSGYPKLVAKFANWTNHFHLISLLG